jgi:hypothetical protein
MMMVNLPRSDDALPTSDRSLPGWERFTVSPSRQLTAGQN